MSTGFTEQWLADRLAKQGAKTCAPVVQKKNKYRALKTEVDGIVFDSKKEANRYEQLKLMEYGGLIRNLKVHVRRRLSVAGVLICSYESDFEYDEKFSRPGQDPWKRIVEDCKGFRTREYLIKKRLMWAIYRIEIRET